MRHDCYYTLEIYIETNDNNDNDILISFLLFSSNYYLKKKIHFFKYIT